MGAGCTHNDGLEININGNELDPSKLPPLDKGFFSKYESEPDQNASSIQQSLEKTYGIDIFDEEYNSLEKIMVILYTDSYRFPYSLILFQNLVTLLNKRLANSTNNLKPNSEHSFYQIVQKFLNDPEPNEIAFITFNQDIQIEKLIDKMSRDNDGKIERDLLNFPYCYHLKDNSPPINIGKQEAQNCFEIGSKDKVGVDILKLHGSLNWYGYLNEIPSKTKTTLFRKDRKINIYSNKILYPKLKWKGQGSKREFYSFPIIVPPVTNKSEIFHKSLGVIWAQAEKKLQEATEIIIFGYSSPTTDFESSNLFKRALNSKQNDLALSIIDPDPTVIVRFAKITGIKRINWYNSSSQYLKMITS